jgi:predicted transcriptional regulator
MTAALKMAAPGELSHQAQKIMAYCKTEAKSIRAMKKHLAVTDAVVHQLLADVLQRGLLRKQPNGMYKTTKDADQAGSLMALVDDAVEQTAANEDKAAEPESEALPLASDDICTTPEPEATEEATAAEFDITDIDADLAALQEQGLVQADGNHFRLADAVFTGFNLDQMATEFAQEQSNNDYPVIDDITAKERALGYCSLLLSPNSTELKRCIEALQMDLAVIRLHQERSA